VDIATEVVPDETEALVGLRDALDDAELELVHLFLVLDLHRVDTSLQGLRPFGRFECCELPATF
jgi:hypothetical protein